MNASDYKYCPRCKSRLKTIADAFECAACGMVIYKNSAPTASMLIVRNNQVLLARRNVEPFKGKVDVIGGFLKYGEHPLRGVLRETQEETGLTVTILDFLGVYMDRYGHGGKRTLNFYYVGRILSGRMRAKDDVAALEWFRLDRLPRPAFHSQEKVFRDLKRWQARKQAPR
ncbi:MAG: NUDIX domain-containing protein [Anaerolineae bacterium]